VKLPPALPGELLSLHGAAGPLACYVAGATLAARPLLLVHSVNAAASAAEVRPLFDHAATRRPVWSFDLPGYGLSDRSDRAYTPRLMTDAVHAVVAEMQRRHGPGAVDALAVSLGCEFLARAAAERADAFHRLALVSPTGFRGLRQRRGAAGSVIGPPWVLRLLQLPGPWLFRGLTRADVIRYFLRRTWGSKDIDDALWRYDVLATQQPGAVHAPLYFLSAQMFSADITTVYEQLAQPVWLSHGTRGDFTDYRGAAAFAARPNWCITVYPDTGALMYFERPQAFNADLDAFLDA
jgi:pimeloyl-ACP methyl ester carboxylesterase